jgi:hypothetical protein
VAEALVETLRPYKKAWANALEATGKEQKAALETMRDQGDAPVARKTGDQ